MPIHFEDLSGHDFERLCFAYLRGLEQWQSLEWYGQLGSDSGRDIWGVRANGQSVCYQCANRQRLTFDKAKADIQKIVSGPKRVPDRFVLISGHKVTARLRDRVKAYAKSISIAAVELWTGVELEELLRKDQPGLLRRFFGGEPFPTDFQRRVLDTFNNARSPIDFAIGSRQWSQPRPPLATVLWTQGLFHRHFETKIGVHGISVDYSSLAFIIEELVAQAAIEIVIPRHSVTAEGVSQLPQDLRSRIRLADPDDESGQASRAILSPVADEFGVRLEPGRLMAATSSAGAALAPLSVLSGALNDLILGCRYSAEIGIPTARCKLAVKWLRQRARNPLARARLALIHGIMSAYREMRLSGVTYVANDERRRSLSFEKLVHDASYEKLSATWSESGIPGRADLVRPEMHRLAVEVAEHSNGALRTRTTNTHVPSTGLDMQRLRTSSEQDGYLPPIVPLARIRTAAEAAWLRAEPDFVPYSGDEEILAIDWSSEKHLRRVRKGSLL